MDHPRVIYWVLASQLMSLAPLFTLVPAWIVLVCLSVVVWRVAVIRYHFAMPGRVLTFFVGLLAAVAIFKTYGTLISRQAGVSLIVLMFSLKLLEVKQFRDAILILFLSYFLLVVNFLYYENIFIVIYIVLTVFVVTLSLITINTVNGDMPYKKLFRFTGVVFAVSAPVAVMLFFFFPRLSEPLWQIPGDARATTGFSESMSPGTVSELFESEDIAFRVRYQSPEINMRNQYWRGLILTEYDGLTWRQSASKSLIRPELSDLRGALKYNVLLEPHGKRWVFSKEMSLPDDPDISVYDDFSMEASSKIRSTFSYSMTSYASYTFNATLSGTQRQVNLQLPDGFNPLIRQWTQVNRKNYDSDQEFVRFVLAFIREREYFYTLRPPIYTEDMVDDFWFYGKKGYCEHYSNAFVFIMRAANIPARVVIGYAGGNFNPYGDYFIVRAKDAHAWTEVWLPDRGWVRIDPTNSIHPSRVEKELSSQFEMRTNAEVFNANPVVNEYVKKLSNTELLRFMMDAIENGWNEWFLGFDKKKQLNLFENLGFKINSTLELVQWMVMLLLIMVAGFGLLLLRKRKKGDKITVAFKGMEKRLARNNESYLRMANEAPMTYLTRIAQQEPGLTKKINDIKKLYSQLRYQNDDDNNNEKEKNLITACKSLRA